MLERLQQEFEALGFHLSAHPLDGYRTSLAKLGVVLSDQLPAFGGQRVKLAGVVLGKQERSTPRSRFAFVQLSDPGGIFEVTVFAELLSRSRACLEAGDPLLIEGEVRLEGDALKVLAASIERLDAALANGGARTQTCIEVRLRDPALARRARRPARRAWRRRRTGAAGPAARRPRRWRSTSATAIASRSPGGWTSSAAPASSGWSTSEAGWIELTGLSQSCVAHPELRGRHALRGRCARARRDHPGPAGRRRGASWPRH